MFVLQGCTIYDQYRFLSCQVRAAQRRYEKDFSSEVLQIEELMQTCLDPDGRVAEAAQQAFHEIQLEVERKIGCTQIQDLQEKVIAVGEKACSRGAFISTDIVATFIDFGKNQQQIIEEATDVVSVQQAVAETLNSSLLSGSQLQKEIAWSDIQYHYGQFLIETDGYGSKKGQALKTQGKAILEEVKRQLYLESPNRILTEHRLKNIVKKVDNDLKNLLEGPPKKKRKNNTIKGAEGC